jgi:hypothetical protein
VSNPWWRPDRLAWWIGVLFAINPTDGLARTLSATLADALGFLVGALLLIEQADRQDAGARSRGVR